MCIYAGIDNIWRIIYFILQNSSWQSYEKRELT
jgi:hypothetical protein